MRKDRREEPKTVFNAPTRSTQVPVIAARLDKAWEEEVARRGDGASFLRAILACFRTELLLLGAWMALEYACIFAQACLVGPLVRWIGRMIH